MSLFKKEFDERSKRMCLYRILEALIEKEEKGQIHPKNMESLKVYRNYLLEIIKKQIPTFDER